MTMARLAGRWPGVPQAPGYFFRIARDSFSLVRVRGQGADPGPGGGDASAQGQVAGIFQPPAAAAADQLPGGMQDPVTQRLWLGAGQVAVQGR